MAKKSNMCILFHDTVVDAVFVDHSVLGTQIKFKERLPRDEHVFEAVAARMKAAEKTPSRVTLCIPRNCAIQRTLRYPAAAKGDLASMIGFEAARHVPLPEEDRLLAWSAVDSPDASQVVLNLVAARKSEIREWTAGFEAAGVPVDEAVLFSALAAVSFGSVPTLFVQTDALHVELCLYGGGMLQDSQLIRRDAPGFSGERVVLAARQMTAKHKSWLGDEGISRILVGGPEPVDEAFEADLGTAFGLHIGRIELPAELAVDDSTVAREALLGATLEGAPTLNLIDDKQRKVPISKRTLMVSALGVLLVAELLAAYGFHISAPARQRRAIEREIAEIRRETDPIQKMKDKNRVFRKQLHQLEQVCGSRASSMEILKAVSDTLPEDTYLRQITCNPEEIVLRGRSKEPDKLPELVMAMPFVATISTSEIGTERDGYYEFSLSASLRR